MLFCAGKWGDSVAKAGVALPDGEKYTDLMKRGTYL